MRKIILTEGQLKYILGVGSKIALNEHVNEIYNVNAGIKLIDAQWESPDDFWYIYITQRKKDNRDTFVKNHNASGSKTFGDNYIAYGIVQGNTKDEAIECLKNIKMNINREYYDKISNKGNIVTSVESTSFPIQSIVMLCNRFNARCYMAVNKRSMSETTGYADSLKRRGMERGREFQFAAGRKMVHNDPTSEWTKKRPYGLIDCDIDDPQAQKELEDLLAQNNIPIFDKYPSHDGMHYVLNSRDAERLDFTRFDKVYRKGNAAPTRKNSDPMVLFKGDACILLYSACGY